MGNIQTAPLQRAMIQEGHANANLAAPTSTTVTSSSRRKRDRFFVLLRTTKKHLQLQSLSSSSTKKDFGGSRSKAPSSPSHSHAPQQHQPYIFGTVCLTRLADVDQALRNGSNGGGSGSLKETKLMPRKIHIQGQLLNCMTQLPTKHHQRSIRRLLRRGCVELTMGAESSTRPRAPRRVYDQDVDFVLSRLRHDVVERLEWRHLDIQSVPNTHVATMMTRRGIAATATAAPLVRVSVHQQSLAAHLAQLLNLKVLHISSTRMEAGLLQEVLAVLPTLPHLKDVALNVLLCEETTEPAQQQQIMTMIETTVMQLLTRDNCTLESLSLPFYPRPESDLWQALASSLTLQSLTMPTFTTTGGASQQTKRVTRADLSILREHLLGPSSSSSLKNLTLWVVPPEQSPTRAQEEEDLSVTNYFEPLMAGLRTNMTLQSIHVVVIDDYNHDDDNDDDEGADVDPAKKKARNLAMVTAQVLQNDCFLPVMVDHNFTLTKIELSLFNFQATDTNNVLRRRTGSVGVTGLLTVATPVLDFYTQLNQQHPMRTSLLTTLRLRETTTTARSTLLEEGHCRGRDHLLRGPATRNEWMMTIIDAATAPSNSLLPFHQAGNHNNNIYNHYHNNSGGGDLSTLYYWLRSHPTLILSSLQ